jgi:hypothetical protein
MSLPSRTRFRDPCPLYFLALSFLLPLRYMCLGFSFLSLLFMSFNSRTRFRDPCPSYFPVLYFPVAPRFAPWHLLVCLCTPGHPGPPLRFRTLLPCAFTCCPALYAPWPCYLLYSSYFTFLCCRACSCTYLFHVVALALLLSFVHVFLSLSYASLLAYACRLIEVQPHAS